MEQAIKKMWEHLGAKIVQKLAWQMRCDALVIIAFPTIYRYLFQLTSFSLLSDLFSYLFFSLDPHAILFSPSTSLFPYSFFCNKWTSHTPILLSTTSDPIVGDTLNKRTRLSDLPRKIVIFTKQYSLIYAHIFLAIDVNLMLTKQVF